MNEVKITYDNFKKEVLESDKPVLVDFWAAWCGPCGMMAPVIKEIADTRSDIKVGKINVDEQPNLARVFGIDSIPTLMLFKNGSLVNTSIGVVPKERVLRML